MSISHTVRRHRGLIAMGVLVVVAVAAYTVLQRTSVQETLVSYQTEVTALGTISVTVSGTGNLEINGTTEVHPSVSGTVDEVLVTEGQSVTTGTVLFTLDADEATRATADAYASYLRAKQSVISAEGQLLRAESDLVDLRERYDEQQDVTAAETTSTPATPASEVTDIDLELAEMDVNSADVSLAVAEASLSAAHTSYQDAQAAEDELGVLAPTAGIVWSLDVESGDTVSADGGSSSGSSGVTVAGTTSSASSSNVPVVLAPAQPLVLQLTINEVDVSEIAVDQRAEIEFDAIPDLIATGKVYEISDEGSNNQGVVTFDVRLTIDVADERLRSGMSGAASIVTDFERDTLLVSNGAVKSDGSGGYYVEVLNDGSDEPQRVTIETGLASATQTQVLSGLSEGDLVVTQTIEVGEDEESSTGSGFMMPGVGGGGPRG